MITPTSVIVGDVVFLREDLHEIVLAEEKTFSALMNHASSCKTCLKAGFKSLEIKDLEKLCPRGRSLTAAWTEYAAKLKEKVGVSKGKKKPRKFGHPQPQKLPKVHPHKGPIISKKDHHGHPLAFSKAPKVKTKSRKVKAPKWK